MSLRYIVAWFEKRHRLEAFLRHINQHVREEEKHYVRKPRVVIVINNNNKRM